MSAGALLALLAFQVGVPTVRLFAPRQARFGWQMFSTASLAPRVVAVHADGRRDTLQAEEYFAFRRGDLNPSAYERLPAHICRVKPGIDTVIMQQPMLGAPAVFRSCR